jgi:uncharacterized protein YcfL
MSPKLCYALRFVAVLALCWLILFLCAGCTSPREQAQADSAATIWEAAEAIKRGAPTGAPVEAIQKNAAAIIKSTGATYAPAGVTP